MNINPIDFNYIDGKNTYPIIDYFDENLEITSNILTSEIDYTSNILNTKINYINTNNINYTNALRNDINKLIEEKTENILLPIPATLKHIYIHNSNLAGEIRFFTASTSAYPVIIPFGVPEYRTKIDSDGKLKIYYTYDPLINLTYGNGWVDIVNSIVGLNAADVNINATVVLLEAQVVNNYEVLENQILQLVLTLNAKSIITKNQSSSIQDAIKEATELTLSQNSLNTIYGNIKSFYDTGATLFLSRAYQSILIRIGQNAATTFYLGAGGVAFGIIISAVLNLTYAETTLSQIKNSITSNTNISSNVKVQLLSSNQDEIIKTYINYASNLYDISFYQGFLNSNTISQQFINNLRVNNLNANIATINNLDVNNGNITNINGIQASEIISAGKIKQYNIYLDNIYLTSNFLYNLSYNYTSERQYPSKLYTNSSTEKVVTLLNKQVFNQTLFLDTSGISYGSGIYETYSSSTYYTYTTKDALFNYNLNDVSPPRWDMNQYNTAGVYVANNSINGSYYGDWIIIKMPQPILLTKYRIYQDTNNPTKAPAEWRVYGSDDGITFYEILEARQATRLTSYTSGFYEKTLANTFTTNYQYFGFVFNKLLSTSVNTDLSFSDLKIYGKEISGNTILNNIFCTSNAVQNVILYNTPQVCKHTGIYCTINTAININGTTYYKYDLDLRQYTTLGVLQIGAQSGDTYRIFKMSMFYASMYLDILTNNEPNICSYDIYMAWKQNGIGVGGAGGYQGLNVNAVGIPFNPLLKNILNTDFWILRNGNNSIDYITLVAKVASLVRVLIEDRIG